MRFSILAFVALILQPVVSSNIEESTCSYDNESLEVANEGGWGLVKSTLFGKSMQVAGTLRGHFDGLLSHEGAGSLTEKLDLLSASAYMLYDGLHIPSAGESWDNVVGLGSNIRGNIDELFQHAKELYPSKISEFKKSVNSVASTATSLHQVVKGAAEQREIPFDSVLEELRNTLQVLFEELKEQFPPPEEAPGHENRTLIINTVLDRVEETFLRVAIKYGASEEVVKNHTSSLMSGVQHIVGIIGDLYEQHPQLAWTFFSIAIAPLFAQGLLLSALRIFGFGPLGPIAGTAAAWLQAWLFRGAIPAGLQCGMPVV
ncbi:uncharacterized protein F5147DRAFT_834485 [Suillus discolor]|uniref:Uncharacterized protein n=1 Tax=Suillus discolor TaxID=1912936 RepID=A0A9P7JX74_9AGAM|nr:uncharacterized protein F5147DRAFT_834485 [Suillus discolor]KAG2114640.1 hypothetical protein F5147DRAFT_834485 [Suillus discolor]